MARTECVSHATKCWWWKCHLDYYAITGYDHCAGALMYLFEYITDNALGDINKSTDDIDVWITITKAGLSNAMIDMFSERSAFEALKKLQEMGFVDVRQQAALGETKQYKFNYDAVSAAIAAWTQSTEAKQDKSKFNTFAGKIAYEARDVPQAILPTDSQAILPTARRQNCLLYKEEDILTNASDKTTPSPSLGTPHENLPEPEHLLQEQDLTKSATRFGLQSTSYELQLDTVVHDFVKNAYRQSRGAKLTNAEAKRWAERIESAEESLSPEEFRTALWRYLNTTSNYLRENKWAIGVFLKDPLQYTDSVPAYQPRQVQSKRSATDPVSSDATANAPARFEPAAYSLLTYVDEWNTLIPEIPCALPIPEFAARLAQKAVDNQEFREVWPVVLHKCILMSRHRPEIPKFLWLFNTTKDGPTWQSIYMGKWDWATTEDRKGGKPDAFDLAMAAALEAEEREE